MNNELPNIEANMENKDMEENLVTVSTRDFVDYALKKFGTLDALQGYYLTHCYLGRGRIVSPRRPDLVTVQFLNDPEEMETRDFFATFLGDSRILGFDISTNLLGDIEKVLQTKIAARAVEISEKACEFFLQIDRNNVAKAESIYQSIQEQLTRDERQRLFKELLEKKTNVFRSYLASNKLDDAEIIFRGLYDELDPTARNAFYSALLEKKISVLYFLMENDLQKADEFFQKIQPTLMDTDRERLVKDVQNKRREIEIREQQIQFEKKLSVFYSLLEKDIQKADEFFQKIQPTLGHTDVERLFKELRNKKREIEIRKQQAPVRDALDRFDFQGADVRFATLDSNIFPDYMTVKANAITRYIEKQYKTTPIAEQALTLANLAPNLLIKARAGSGKTSVLTWKTALLIERYRVNPDHILILAFNRKAAIEIGGRIRKDLGLDEFENARTFHSLAHQLVQPKGKLLFDDGKGEFSRPALSNFVKDLLRDVWTPALQAKIYEFFRKEMGSLERAGTLLNDADYYVYIRNSRDISLNGERVKSKGEKYLADFLFEHNIPYAYESLEFWSGYHYHPDFSLYRDKMIIEFWGIDENDPGRKLPSWWKISWDEYRSQMNEKRRYWHEKNTPLIEFSTADLQGQREDFEAKIKARLTEAGIPCEKMRQEDLEKLVVRNQVDRLTELLVQFIQKAKKCLWSAEEIRKRLAAYQPMNERENVFLQQSGKKNGLK